MIEAHRVPDRLKERVRERQGLDQNLLGQCHILYFAYFPAVPAGIDRASYTQEGPCIP
jgi:hypothetical protein